MFAKLIDSHPRRAISLDAFISFTIVVSALLVFCSTVNASQIDIPGPAGSGRFGGSVTVLPNGNFVVIDTLFDLSGPTVADVGAVYLYDGSTLNVISTLKGSTANDQVGSGGIDILTNGNFVISSPNWDNPSPVKADVGAATWCSAATGCNGNVGASNSLIGGTANDQVGNAFVIVLNNGNYVVRSTTWDNPSPAAANAGAATWGNGTTGTSGLISANNSLVGGTANDQIGSFQIVALANGNYVVDSPLWDNPSPAAVDAGAVTWGNGTGGTIGLVTAANSLVGGRPSDSVGANQVKALSNGNYVVASQTWDNPSPLTADVGAVTWGNGLGGTTGLVTPNNSLIGGTAGDNVGSSNGVVPLSNGNYVVRSPLWSNPVTQKSFVGAATWGNGATGITGPVNTNNSLVGDTPGDEVSLGEVYALPNGNYVVLTPSWDNPSPLITNVGAVTWGNGTSGITGSVTSSNSLVGLSSGDQIAGVAVLFPNSNYLALTTTWDNPSPLKTDVGSVTWCSGTGGTVGPITANNSLVGGTTDDRIGSGSITYLANGNYVVGSPVWDNPSPLISNVGAVTWCNGNGTTVGAVTSANSLVGGTANDQIGSSNQFFGGSVVPLANGNYVVTSPFWDNPSPLKADVGAVTWCNGTTGLTGLVTAANSMTGGTANDQAGLGAPTALTNGNYVFRSPNWDNPSPATANVGAMTWGDGSGGTIGLITTGNSLVGSTANDQIGFATPIKNGNYVILASLWDNPAGPILNAGAATYGKGTGGTAGAITSADSVLGTAANGVNGFSFDYVRNRLIIGRGANNTVSILFFNTTAIANGDISSPATWDNGVPNSLTNVTIPTGRTVTVNSPTTIGSLSIASGATLTLNANLNLAGNLAIGTQINTGANTLSLSCSTTVSGASASNYVIGSVKKDFCTTGTFSYPIGTANGYSPVDVNITTLALSPSSLTVKANQGNSTGMNAAQSAQRYWTLTEAGDLTANLTFNYLDPTDVVGTEASYKLYRFDTGNGILIPSTLNTSANTVTANGISVFSDWAIGSLAPVTVSGRVVTSDLRGLRNTTVSMTDSNGVVRSATTSSFGFFSFADVAGGQAYTFRVQSRLFRFAPQTVTVNDNLTLPDFVGLE